MVTDWEQKRGMITTGGSKARLGFEGQPVEDVTTVREGVYDTRVLVPG